MNAAPINSSNSSLNSAWRLWFSTLIQITPSIYQGTAAPAVTDIPKKVGDIYCDVSAGKVYVSTGTIANTDWKLLN